MNMIYLKNVSTLEFNKEKCIKCLTCLSVCPREVLKFVNKEIQIIEKDRCIECGACSLNCEPEALKVDAGVGCAAAMISALKSGKPVDEACCGKDEGGGCC